MISRTLSIFIPIFWAIVALAQDSLDVEFRFMDSCESEVEKLPREKAKIAAVDLESTLDQRLWEFYADAYLGAWYRQEDSDSSTTRIVFFYMGERYYLMRLGPGTLVAPMRNKVGYRSRFYSNRPFRHTEVLDLFNKILVYAEEHGYPFATVGLDSLEISDHGISASVLYEPGPLITFDSLRVQGSLDIKPGFLQSQLGLYRGKPFNQGLVAQIPVRLKQMEFLTLGSAPEVRFRDEHAQIDLALERRSVNQIDAVLGLLPNENTPGKVLITGLVLIDLHNLFSSAKNLRLEWQRIDVSSQLLDIAYRHPKLLNSPLDFEGRFYLLKQDTTFINREASLRLAFTAGSAGQLGVGSRLQTSRIISTSAYAGAAELPAVVDFNLNYHGLEYRFSSIDDPAFPTRGIRIGAEAMAGQKKILQNPAFDPVWYNSIKLNSPQYRVETAFEVYTRAYRNVVARGRMLAGHLRGSSLFQNDLFRLGGLNSIRGFNENYFFASSYLIANLELRFALERGTYFFTFIDQAFLRNEPAGKDMDYPTGLGAGINLATEAGNFNLVFALGRNNFQTFSLNLAKIHFGYVSRF